MNIKTSELPGSKMSRNAFEKYSYEGRTPVSKCVCLEQATPFVCFSNKEALSIINVFIFRADVWFATQMAALNDRPPRGPNDVEVAWL
jgi:hypothetical protein